jgi:hypothetical protein
VVVADAAWDVAWADAAWGVVARGEAAWGVVALGAVAWVAGLQRARLKDSAGVDRSMWHSCTAAADEWRQLAAARRQLQGFA